MSINIRAKFRCNNVTNEGQGKQTVRMSPVYSDDPKSENHQFWEATPIGWFEMSYINRNIQFVPGGEYYLDITPVKKSA